MEKSPWQAVIYRHDRAGGVSALTARREEAWEEQANVQAPRPPHHRLQSRVLGPQTVGHPPSPLLLWKTLTLGVTA